MTCPFGFCMQLPKRPASFLLAICKKNKTMMKDTFPCLAEMMNGVPIQRLILSFSVSRFSINNYLLRFFNISKLNKDYIKKFAQGNNLVN